MRKQIKMFLFTLCLSVSFAETVFASTQFGSYFRESSELTSCHPCGCYFADISIVLSPMPTASCSQLMDVFLYVDGLKSFSVGSSYCSGSIPVISTGGILMEGSTGPCIADVPAHVEETKARFKQHVAAHTYWFEGYVANADGTSMYIKVIPELEPLDPSKGPIGLPALTPPGLQTITKDPINIATGEVYFSATDFSLEARGPQLALFRKYRSFSTLNGMFGYGWRTDFDTNLTVDYYGNVIIYDDEGTGIYFLNRSGKFIPSPGNYSTIVKNADNTYTLTDKHGIVSRYSVDGRLTTRTDRNGNTLTFIFNPAQVDSTYIQDASGRRITFNFDVNKHITSAKDPAGNIFRYAYDLNGNLVTITDPTGAITKYIYDVNHKIVSMTNANGHNTYFHYDSNGRADMNWQDGNVNKVTLRYQPYNTTVITDSLGNINTYSFDEFGILLSHVDPLGAKTTQRCDLPMKITSRVDALYNQTRFSYDGHGNIIEIVGPLTNRTEMTYTQDFNLIDFKYIKSGEVTKYFYDVKGNLTSIVDPLGGKDIFVYDQFGDVVSATDSRGNTTNYAYDAFGHVIQETDPLGNSTVFTYK